ncbi:MAG: hypothetical protein ACRD02_00200 [Acidimicrobiia bacterium]
MTTAQTSAQTGSLTRTFALITVAGGVLAFLLGPQAPIGQQIWPPTVELNPPPGGAQLGLFMLLGAIESLAFGAGVAFLLLGRKPLRRLFGPRRAGLATATHLAVFWLLWSWWLHDGLHMVVGLQARGLLAIEYAFHVTLILAGGILAYGLATLAGVAPQPVDR